MVNPQVNFRVGDRSLQSTREAGSGAGFQVSECADVAFRRGGGPSHCNSWSPF